MKTLKYLATLTPVLLCSALSCAVLCCSAATATEGPLAILVHAYRESPTPLRRDAIVTYAASHPKEAPLANLALGISAYEQRSFTAALVLLKPLAAQLPAIADYPAYYAAAA